MTSCMAQPCEAHGFHVCNGPVTTEAQALAQL